MKMTMKFYFNCDFEEFKKYYEMTYGKLEELEEKLAKQVPSRLIVWRDKKEIIGHAFWHESNTREHRRGDPRDEIDSKLLRTLIGSDKEFIELHMVWLKEEYRGKGYGWKFFAFFENLIAKKDFDSIIYYTDHPAAIHICRKHGYRENYGFPLEDKAYFIFYLPLKKYK
jgi:GNAT superfamily N-acetyltransferase